MQVTEYLPVKRVLDIMEWAIQSSFFFSLCDIKAHPMSSNPDLRHKNLDDYKLSLMSTNKSDLLHAQVVRMDIDEYAQLASKALLDQNKARKIRRAVPRSTVHSAVVNLVKMFKPMNEYYPPAERPNLRSDKSVSVECENPDCKRLARGGTSVQCARCGLSAYCSVKCCEADATFHSQVVCRGTVNHELRRLAPELLEFVDTYFGEAEDAISTLAYNEWIMPLMPCATVFRNYNHRLGAIGDWLKYRIASEFLATCVHDGEKEQSCIPCMVCGAQVPFPGLADLTWDIADLVTEITKEEEEEASPSVNHGEKDDLHCAIDQKTILELTGISPHGAIRANFNVLCGVECMRNYDFVRHAFVDVLFWSDPLSGDPCIDIVFNRAPSASTSTAVPKTMEEIIQTLNIS